jgi:hypothetical protein
MNRLLVVAVVCLAALAAGDALRGGDDATPPRARVAEPAATEPAAPETSTSGSAGQSVLVPARRTELRTAGGVLPSHVVRGADEVLSATAVAEAFPSFSDGPTEILHLAVAPDGTLVLAVRRFPSNHELEGALELWRGDRLVATWAVPPRWFAGGLAFVRPGGHIAVFGLDGGLAAVYDRRGNQVGLE